VSPAEPAAERATLISRPHRDVIAMAPQADLVTRFDAELLTVLPSG